MERFYSKETGGFYSSDIFSEDMRPIDCVEITQEEYENLISGQESGLEITASEDGKPSLSVRPVIVTVPSKVTMRQARLALHAAGLLSQVQTTIDALDEPPRIDAQIEWDYSSEMYRDKPFVQMLADALGLSDEDLDNLFITASTL